MTGTELVQDPFVDAFRALETELPGPDWVAALRRDALEAWKQLGWPTTKQEAWKQTDLKAVRETTFEPADREVAERVGLSAVSSYAFDELEAAQVVLVDGLFRPELSDLDAVGDATVASLAQVLADDAAFMKADLAQHADPTDHPFRALNTALFQDGVVIDVPDGTVLERPVHVVCLATDGRVSHPRVLIRLGRSAEATVVETYAPVEEGSTYLTNGVTEIVAGENASLRHYKLERESKGAFHIASQQVHQARASSVRTHNICLGGELTRNDLNAVLDAEGSVCLMNGLFSLTDAQHCDNHTRIDHLAPNCESHQLYKGILDGKSRGVFLGRIFVDPIAQGTNADQHNPNLLLSDEALVNTTPQLEIFADDVRCTHGSTFGQLDPEALFYMESRGLAHETAKAVLTYAFAAEVTETIQLAPVREKVNELVLERLPKGDLAREALE